MSNKKFDPLRMQPPDKHGIVAHTPDPTKYFSPSGDQVRHMRSGIKAVMIPRATRHGGSRGFESGPGVLSVDPSKPLTGDGGIMVDLSLITPETSKMAYDRACELTHDPEEQIIRAYQLMGMAVEGESDMHTEDPSWDDEEEEERTNPVMPGSYVVPKSTITGAQLENKPKNKKLKTVTPKAVKQKKAAVATKEASSDPVLEMLVSMKRDIDALKSAKKKDIRAFDKKRKKLPPLPQKPSVPNYGEAWVEDEPPKTMTVPEPTKLSGNTVYTPEQVMQALKAGYDKLGIPNLGPEAKKPGFRVEFDLGAAGRQEAWYHWVGEHNGCLFLIYDTRFEYGLRYSPPFLGPENPITVRLPDHGGKEYRVLSLDLTHPFGIFAITSLVMDQEQTLSKVGSIEHAISPIINKLITDDVDAGDW